MSLRRALHVLGYRYSLHRKDLPGTPDLVFPGRRKVIFVHGCFWHRHHGCTRATTPKTRWKFWTEKFKANVARDAKVQSQLSELGWDVMVVWECEIRNGERLMEQIEIFLGPPASY
jgi:DNA mismatch endonuclease (patch repair protein)